MAEYALPDLPYDYGALAPHIAGEIMELHHALDRGGGGGEVGSERVEGAEVLVDRGCELAGGLVPALGGEVLPEGGVVDVPAEVEGEGLLHADDGAEVAGLARLTELVEDAVEDVHVGLVVLGVPSSDGTSWASDC